MSPSTWIAALALAFGATAGGDEDVALRLAELDSPVAAERARAERWLAAHLGPDDMELVARAAAQADAEARRRLARAVGAEGRLLGLAAGLLAAPDAAASGVGRDALREIALAWSPILAAMPLVDEELVYALQRSVSERSVHLLRVDLAAPLDEVLDLLRRSGEVPLNLVLDPLIADRGSRRIAAEELSYVAAWSQILPVLAGIHGLALEGVGIDAGGDIPGGAFVLFRAPIALERGSLQSGFGRLAEWTAEVARPPDSPGAARKPRDGIARRRRMEALLASGWPAAWGWVQDLEAAGDASAGEALLGPTGSGVWPESWRSAAAVEALLDRLRLLQAGGFEPEAGRVARALAAAPPRLADGAVVPALLGAAWDAAQDPERRQLLVALEGIAAPGDAAQVAAWDERLRKLFARPVGAADPALLRQALRAWCAVLAPTGGAPPELAAPFDVLGTDTLWSTWEHREVAALLARCGATPPLSLDGLPPLPPAPSTPAPRTEEVAGHVGARHTLVVWYAMAGQPDRAAEVLRATLPAPGAEAASGELLRRMVRRGDGALARALLAAVRAGAEESAADAVERVAFLAGLLEPERRAELCARVARMESGGGASVEQELVLLGAAAGVPAEPGAAARERLLEVLEEALQADPTPWEILPVLQAVEHAIGDLLRAAADGEAAQLRRAASVRVLRAPPGAARQNLARGGWPELVSDLDALDLALLRRP